jgi:hypothetical protein
LNNYIVEAYSSVVAAADEKGEIVGDRARMHRDKESTL